MSFCVGQVYSIRGKVRGRAVIISNEYFTKDTLDPRYGNTEDVNNLERLFNGLQFTVVKYLDMASNQVCGFSHSSGYLVAKTGSFRSIF